MTKLTDERIQELWGVSDESPFYWFARAIESEAYRNGELAMRERAAVTVKSMTLSDCFAECIRNLPIEGVE